MTYEICDLSSSNPHHWYLEKYISVTLYKVYGGGVYLFSAGVYVHTFPVVGTQYMHKVPDYAEV